MIAQQPFTQGIARGELYFGIERGAHPQPACINTVAAIFGGFTETVDQFAAHFFEEISRIHAAFAALGDKAQRLGRRRATLRRSDEAIGLHLIQHEIAAIQRDLFLPLAAIAFGGLGQDG